MPTKKPLQTYCYLCSDIPSISYEVKKFILYINFICKNGHQRIIEIKNYEKKEKCKICQKILEKKNFEYNIDLNEYICLNCIDRTNENISNNYLKTIDFDVNQFFQKFKNFLDDFEIDEDKPITKSFYGIFSMYFKDFSILKQFNLYHTQLNVNISTLFLIKWNLLFFSDENFKIILKGNYPYILFNEFFSEDYLNYYQTNELLEIYKMLKLYIENKITINNEFRLNLNIEIMINKEKENNLFNKFIFNEHRILSNEKEINLDYEIKLVKLETLISNFFHEKEIFPSLFIIKRKLCKLIIDSLYSVYYFLLDDIQPNHDSLLYLYKRLRKTYNEINNDNLKLKIEGVLSKLNYLLMNMIGEEQNKLRTEIYMNSYNDVSEFNEKELDEINKICSQLEIKNKDEKIEYNYLNYDYIILKFSLNFLHYIKDKSNSLIHILFEEISYYFYEPQIKDSTTLFQLISNIFKKKYISSELNLNQEVNLFLSRNSKQETIKSIMKKIEDDLVNDQTLIINKNINEEFLNLKKDINMIKNNIEKLKKNYDTILKINLESNDKKILGKKPNKFEEFFINKINCQMNEINEKMNYVNKNNPIMNEKINNIILKNILNEKLKLILPEIETKKFKDFSLDELFIKWKEEEKIRINKYLVGNVLIEIKNQLSNYNFECFVQFLYNFSKNNNIMINLYNEEPDLNLNLFLYKNKINPKLCKLKNEY